MTVSLQVYINGQFYNKEDAKVSVFDHCYLYGDGIFEGIRLYDGCVFRWEDHLDRLFDSAKYIMLEIGMTREELTEALVETIRRNELRDGYIRLVVSRGEGTLGLAPWLCPKATVVIIADSIKLYPQEYYDNGLKLVTVPTLRNHVQSLNARVKSCNYLNNILAKIEAHNGGCIEALMLDERGCVVECTGDNIFLIKNGRIVTPSPHLGALEGITRNSVMELARERGYEITEAVFTRYEVFTADEIFLTGSAAEIIPVVEVDKRIIGDGKVGSVTKELTAAFRDVTSKDGYQVYA